MTFDLNWARGKFPAFKETDDKLQAKRKELAAIFTEAGPELDPGKVKAVAVSDGTDLHEIIKARNDEIEELTSELDKHTATAKAAYGVLHGDAGGEPGAATDPVQPGPRRSKSLGQLLVESDAFTLKAGTSGPQSTLDIDLTAMIRPQATLMETGAGWDPESTRSGLVVPDAQRPVQVTDLIPSFQWGQAAYVYMEETTFTNNAAETAEGGTYGEAALALTERTSPVRKITVWLPVTDEQLADVPGARGYIDARLRFMVQQRLDAQILTGSGVAPNLTGANNVTGIQTQAKGTDPTPDAIYKALTKVRVTGRAIPGVVIFHPNDWQDVRLLRTSDGVYIWGNPSEAGPERIWGVQAVQSDAQTENTALVADFANFAFMPVRRGIDVQITNSHASDFINGKQAIRADMRTALVFVRPEAICTVTGI